MCPVDAGEATDLLVLLLFTLQLTITATHIAS